MANEIAGIFGMSIWRWWKERRQIKALQAEEREALVKMRKAVEEAKRNGATGGETREIEEELIWPARSASDAIDMIKCSQLVRKALRYSLPLPPKPSPPMFDSDVWHFSNNGGGWLLSPDAEFALNKEIREEEKYRRELWMSWAAAITGIIGALTGLAAIILQFA